MQILKESSSKSWVLGIFMLISAYSINAQIEKTFSIDFSFGYKYLNIGDFDNPEYNNLRDGTVDKLFDSGDINPKVSVIIEKGTFKNWFLSLNKTNYGKFTEGVESINSKITAYGLGVGYNLRGYLFKNKFGKVLNLGAGIMLEARINYNDKYEAVQIDFEGILSDQISTTDNIEKWTPELAVYPNLSFNLFNFLHLNVGLSFHAFLSPELSSKIASENGTFNVNAFNEENRIAILFMPKTGIRIMF